MLVDGLQQFLVRAQKVQEKLCHLSAALQISRAAFLNLGGRKINIAVDVFGTAPNEFAELEHEALNERRPADRLLHAQFSALHFARQGHFALTR